MYKIYKRTFEALKHPKGSLERVQLNLSAITSEYMTSYKYQVIGDRISFGYKTRKLAQEAIDIFNKNPGAYMREATHA